MVIMEMYGDIDNPWSARFLTDPIDENSQLTAHGWICCRRPEFAPFAGTANEGTFIISSILNAFATPISKTIHGSPELQFLLLCSD